MYPNPRVLDPTEISLGTVIKALLRMTRLFSKDYALERAETAIKLLFFLSIFKFHTINLNLEVSM